MIQSALVVGTLRTLNHKVPGCVGVQVAPRQNDITHHSSRLDGKGCAVMFGTGSLSNSLYSFCNRAIHALLAMCDGLDSERKVYLDCERACKDVSLFCLLRHLNQPTPPPMFVYCGEKECSDGTLSTITEKHTARVETLLVV